MPLSEDPREREDGALLRLIRAAIEEQGGSLPSIDEETLTAYVMGTASPSQSVAVQNALIKSAEFRQQLLDLMEISVGAFTAEERQAFKEATPPRLEEVRKLARLASELVPQVGSPRAAVLKPGPRRGWLEWALGSWAVAATVAACALFVVVRSMPPTVGSLPPGSRIPSGTSGPAGPQGVGTPGHEQPQRPFTIGVVQTIALRGLSRGGGPEALPVVTVKPSTRVIALTADPPDVPDRSTVRVTLIDPDGRLVVDEMHPVEDFSGKRSLAIQTQAPLHPGRYVLTIRGRRGDLAEAVTYPFAIRLDAH